MHVTFWPKYSETFSGFKTVLLNQNWLARGHSMFGIDKNSPSFTYHEVMKIIAENCQKFAILSSKPIIFHFAKTDESTFVQKTWKLYHRTFIQISQNHYRNFRKKKINSSQPKQLGEEILGIAMNIPVYLQNNSSH